VGHNQRLKEIRERDMDGVPGLSTTISSYAPGFSRGIKRKGSRSLISGRSRDSSRSIRHPGLFEDVERSSEFRKHYNDNRANFREFVKQEK
jgi:hypothetical protein